MADPVAAGAGAPPSGAAVVAALRERLTRLGGGALVAPGTLPRARRVIAEPARAEPTLLGFAREHTACGPAWVRRTSVDLGPFLARAGAPGPATAAHLGDLACWARGAGAGEGDRGIAVLDIESLGLHGSGVVAFLIGIGRSHGERLDVDQILLADPGAEAAQLSAMGARLPPDGVLLTYNGKTFDVPVLTARCIVNRVAATPLEEVRHCDVLAPVRRLFRHRLGACTLRQAEVLLLGFEREDDVAGSEAPARFRAWLDGAGASVMSGVVRHNEIDLCSTVVLAAKLSAHLHGRMVEPVGPADRYHLGLHLERAGMEGVEEQYRAAYASGWGPWDRRAGHRLARRLHREPGGRAGEAIDVWDGLWSADAQDLVAARSLCLALERAGEIAASLRVARRAREVSERMPRRHGLRRLGEPPHGWGTDWERRVRRLERRLQRLERLQQRPDRGTRRRDAGQSPRGQRQAPSRRHPPRSVPGPPAP